MMSVRDGMRMEDTVCCLDALPLDRRDVSTVTLVVSWLRSGGRIECIEC